MGGRPSSPASGKDRVVTGVVAGVSALTVMLVLVLLLLGPGRGHGLADGGDGVHIGDALDPIIAEKGTENEGATVETMAEPAAGTVSEPAAEPAEEPAAEPAAEPAQSIALPLQSATETDAIQLLALGDSIALGIGDEAGGGYAVRLGSELEALHGRPVVVTHLAVNGIRSDELLDRLAREETRQAMVDANLITVSIGGNDLMRVVKKHFLALTLDKFEDGRIRFGEHLADILALLRKANAEADIYVLGLFNPLAAWFADMPELADIMAAWNGTIRKAAAEQERVFYVPVDDLFAEDSPALTAEDFVHPNEMGYNRIAGRALEVLVQHQADNEVPGNEVPGNEEPGNEGEEDRA